MKKNVIFTLKIKNKLFLIMKTVIITWDTAYIFAVNINTYF